MKLLLGDRILFIINSSGTLFYQPVLSTVNDQRMTKAATGLSSGRHMFFFENSQSKEIVLENQFRCNSLKNEENKFKDNLKDLILYIGDVNV